MKTLLLIDGNPIMHRAFHAIPPFKTKAGIPTNVLYGFFSMLSKAINDFFPTHIIVCFDTPKPTFRNKLFDQYQAQRPKLTDEFKTQIPTVKEALNKGGIVHIEKDGYEADDLIGTIANKYERNEFKVLILSGDRDVLQLVKNNIVVVSPQTGLSNMKIYNSNEVVKKFQIKPNLIPDFKALVGDPADNYPGAKGIGPKTAVKLIQEYQSIENLFKNIEKIKDQKLKRILQKSKDIIFLSKKLAQISTDIKIDFNFDLSKYNGFKHNLKDYLLRFEIQSLVKRIFSESSEKTKKNENKNKEPQMSLF